VRQIQIDTPLRQAAVVMPAIHFPTAAARAALPPQVPFRDAVFNTSRLGMLLYALEAGDFELMAVCMQDRLHQPYRLPLIPGSEAALEAARAMGGVAALSGAGPSLIAFAPRRLPEVAAAMQAAFAAAGLESRTWILPLDEEGSQLRVSPANLATGPQFC
jgi:homoserine kinase